MENVSMRNKFVLLALNNIRKEPHSPIYYVHFYIFLLFKKKNQYFVVSFILFNTNFFKKYFPHFILKSVY